MTEKSFMAMAREAQAKGLKTFDPGVPCAQGHVSDRYVSKAACVACMRVSDALKTERRRQKERELTAPYAHLIVTRKEAIERGLNRYFTGKKCPLGHVSERYLIGHGCVDCAMPLYWKNSKSPRKIRLVKQEDGSYIGGPCRVCGDTRRNKSKNCPTCLVDIVKKGYQAWYDALQRRKAKNPEAWKKNANRIQRESRARNPDVAGKARADRFNATPKWLDYAHKAKIKEIYRSRPKGCHIDHVVPVVNDKVCGLHVWQNLQILTAEENVRKHNKWPTCQRSMQPAWFDDKI